MPQKMLDDFRFLFSKKEDAYKNIIKDEHLLKIVNHDYCLYYYNKAEKKDINLIHYINNYEKTEDGKVIFNPQIEKCHLDIIKKLLSKKMSHFNQLIKYHSTIMLKYKRAGSLSISIRLLLKRTYITAQQTDSKDLKDFIKKFFNNMRSRKAFSKNVIGYYWVILLDSSESPYIHINFYLKDKNFNSLVGYDINEICFNILNKHRTYGEIIYHTITENSKNGKGTYNNKDSNEIKENYYSSIRPDFCGISFDLFNDIENNLNKGGRFNRHMYRLAKKTYFFPSGRSIGFSSIS